MERSGNVLFVGGAFKMYLWNTLVDCCVQKNDISVVSFLYVLIMKAKVCEIDLNMAK
jgi:pentatricopeptide repeat protein